jgi:hypothetical protein
MKGKKAEKNQKAESRKRKAEIVQAPRSGAIPFPFLFVCFVPSW